jgi:hypothetical protein
VEDKRVTTKTAPGCFTTVCKSQKDGKLSEWSMKFTESGMSVHIKMGGLEATECYKRVPDIEGTWRMVAQSGMENYLACLGVTGTQAAEMITMSSSEYFTLERMAGGKVRSLTNSKWFPSEMVIKMGETYTLEMPGFGSTEVIHIFNLITSNILPVGFDDRIEGHHSECVEVQGEEDHNH